MLVQNSAITDFQTVILGHLDTVTIKLADTVSLLDTINANLDPADALSLSLIDTAVMRDLTAGTNTSFGALSDKILQSGKDLLLMADQANQFICVSNDSFSRVVDIFLYLKQKGFETDIKNQIIGMETLIDDLNTYLTGQVGITSTVDASTAQTQANTLNNLITTELNTIETNFVSVNALFKKSVDILKIFQNVLSVNATVGIALSVTKHAWEELKIMTLLDYQITVTEDPLVNTTADSTVLTENTLFPTTIGDQYLKALDFFSKVFLDSQTIIAGVKKYKVINKKDLVVDALTVDSSFGPLLNEAIQSTTRANPDLLNSVFGDIAFVESLDLSDATLTTYYNTLVSPAITLDEFLAEFSSLSFTTLITKYSGGITSDVVSEYITNHKSYLQYLMVKQVVNSANLNTLSFSYDEPMITDGEVFDDSANLSSLFSTEVVTYLKSLRSDYSVQQAYFDRIDALVSDYHVYNQTKPLLHTSQSGEISILEYNMGEIDVLSKVLSKFKYNYSVYQDDLQIYYAEVKINDNMFVIRNNRMILSYQIKTENATDVEYVTKEDRHLILEYGLSGYLANNTYDTPQIELVDYKEETEEIIESKLLGDEIVNLISVSTSYNDVNSLYTISKDVTTTTTNTTYISDNPVERITTNITNIYRDELLNNRMDFSQARINSIVSSLRFLRYRDELENYIDLTWDMNIPHPPRA